MFCGETVDQVVCESPLTQSMFSLPNLSVKTWFVKCFHTDFYIFQFIFSPGKKHQKQKSIRICIYMYNCTFIHQIWKHDLSNACRHLHFFTRSTIFHKRLLYLNFYHYFYHCIFFPLARLGIIWCLQPWFSHGSHYADTAIGQ